MAEQPSSSDHEAAPVLSAPAERERLLGCRRRDDGRGLGSRLSGSPF